MLKKILIIMSVLLGILSLKTLKLINNTNTTNEKKTLVIKIKKNKKNDPIGKLIIDKINLERNLYNIDSDENTIEKNVEILKESILPEFDNSIMILAAHSGIGPQAYFQNLNEINLNDIIKLEYQGKKYEYTVTEIWEEKKNGYINIKKYKNKQLVLTTCSPNRNGLQLIISCKEKESN